MKKILLFLIMFIPIFVSAECNYEVQKEYAGYARDVSEESIYDPIQKKFDVVLYNVNEKFTVKYNGINYRIVDNKVEIRGVKEGTDMKIELFAPSGCSGPARYIYIDQPYFNEFYGSTMCYGYEGKVSYCSYKYLQVDPTIELVEGAISNYESGIKVEEKEEVVEEVEITFGEKVVDLVDTKLIKVFMFLFTAYVTYVIYNDLYIKVKHKL